MSKFKRIVSTDRRTAPRIPASKVIPHGATRLASGQEVDLINISLNRSMLIGCETMLAPGSTVRLKLDIPGHSLNLEGHVLRSRVTGLKMAKIQYEAAIILDEEFPEALAEKLRSFEVEIPPFKQPSSPDTNQNPAELPQTAHLWVLNTPEVNLHR
jgi:hypothetical protein